MSGLYIHIPFCVRKCAYCDFTSVGIGSGDDVFTGRMIDALITELKMRTDFEADIPLSPRNNKVSRETYTCSTISSVFIGGGTPSIVPIGQMERLLGAVDYAVCGVNSCVEHQRETSDGAGAAMPSDFEFTIECNPKTVTMDKLKLYRDHGVNRISLGLQSTHDDELYALGRIHTYDDFLKSYDLVRQAGFDNVNVDLMMSIPLQTVESYEQTLRRVIDLKPEHISAYSLIIEPGTPFFEKYSENPPTDETLDQKLYMMTCEMLGDAGYDHYEISNFAKKKHDIYVCKHNMNYWRRGSYIGIGPAAASYFSDKKKNGTRSTNTSDIDAYLRALEAGRLPNMEVEELTDRDVKVEELFLGFRTHDGIPENAGYDRDFFRSYIDAGLMYSQNGRLILTDRGMLVSDKIIDEVMADFLV